MDDVTAVIITYEKDLDRFNRCVESIQTHGHKLCGIVVVVNDEKSTVKKFKSITCHDERYSVLHCNTVAAWTGKLDWWSQQYYKLAVSKIISTPWYLLLDSDDVLLQQLTETALFCDSRARCIIENFKQVVESDNPKLIDWLRKARQIVGLGTDPLWTMGNLTPMMMRTDITRQLFDIVQADFFDVTKDPREVCLEFYLYHAWLECHGLFDHLYHPVDSLAYAVDKRGISTYNI